MVLEMDESSVYRNEKQFKLEIRRNLHDLKGHFYRRIQLEPIYQSALK